MSGDPPPSALDAHLGFWLRSVSNAVSRSFARTVEANGVTVAEWVFMRVLYDFDRVSPTVLADRLGMTKGAISKLADRLVEKGLVARRANPDDKRAQTLALEPKGRDMVPLLASFADENDWAFFGALDERERDELDRLLRKLVSARGLTAAPTD